MRHATGAALAAVVVGCTLLLAVEGAALPSGWLPLREAAALQHARGSDSFVPVGSALYAAVLAPAARLFSASAAYRFATVLSALLWALTAVPAYLLARRLVSPAVALAVAALAVLVPASVYATAAVPEALGQLLAVSSLPLLARASGRGDRRELAGALALATLAVLAAPWLVTLPPALLVAYELPRRDARSFLRWPRSLVFGAYAVLAYFLLLRLAPAAGSALARPEDVARAAAASLAVVVVGTAVVPWLLTAGERPRTWTPETALLASCTVAFLLSAGAFGAAGRGVDERPLLAVVPLVLALAAAAWLGGAVRPRSMAIVAGVVALAALALPRLGRVPAAYAAGLSFVAPSGGSRGVMAAGAVTVVAVGLLLVLLLRRRRYVVPALVAVALLYGQAQAWSSVRAQARRLAAADPVPHGWIDDSAGRDAHVLAVGTAGAFDPRLLAQLALWNRSLRGVRVLDPSQADPRTGLLPVSYGPVVLARELDLVGPRLGASTAGTLVQAGSPLQLAATVEGRYPDGWGGPVTTYRRFGDAPGPGRLVVTASRPAKPAPTRGEVREQVGPLHGSLAPPQHIVYVHSPQTITTTLDVPRGPFRVVITVDPTFSPLDFAISDNRELGAQLDFGYRKSNR